MQKGGIFFQMLGGMIMLTLPGQLSRIQGLLSVLLSGHSRPPLSGAGSLQTLHLCCVPFPQVTEQEDHSPHSPQEPSTTNKIKLIVALYTFILVIVYVLITSKIFTHGNLTQLSFITVQTITCVVCSAIYTGGVVLACVIHAVIYVLLTVVASEAKITLAFVPPNEIRTYTVLTWA